MDLIKQLTGKNPTEYEAVAKSLVDNADVDLFAKLVKQDNFIFDFIKENVARRIQQACNKDNYLNLLKFFKYYSPFYDTMFASVLHSFAGESVLPEIKNIFLNGTNEEKAYCVKYFSFMPKEKVEDIIEDLRYLAYSDYVYLATNSAETLSVLEDEISKKQAILKLNSDDEFEQYDGVKFLVNYGAKDTLCQIVNVMKKSSLSENIAAEIIYLINLEEFLENDFETAILVMCYIINAIPEIIPVSIINDCSFVEIFKEIIEKPLTSTCAVLLRLAQSKFEELVSNDEYLYDCDKKTKDEVIYLDNMLKNLNKQKLESYLYDELYEESDFVSFVLDFVEETEEIETLLECKNQTLILKALTRLKELGKLTDYHKTMALKNVTQTNICQVVEIL